MSSQLDELIALGSALEPPAGAADRTWEALQHHLAPPPGANPTGAGSVGRTTAVKWFAGLVLAVGVSGLLLMDMEREPRPLRSEPLWALDEPGVSAPGVPPIAMPLASATAEPASEVVAPSRPRPRPRPRHVDRAEPVAALLTERTPDEFAEVRLLEQIRGTRDPHRQLQLIAEHERRFSGGQLVPERMACHVDALCSLGRVAEARRIVAELLRLAPQSHYAARARKSCAAP